VSVNRVLVSLPCYKQNPRYKTLLLSVCAQLDRLIEEEGRDVVMVLHSYGGVVGSEAARVAGEESA
jgi:pimeloyl-ACP methyl ester carboxylesterase